MPLGPPRTFDTVSGHGGQVDGVLVCVCVCVQQVESGLEKTRIIISVSFNDA